MQNIFEALENVTDEKSFIEFLTALYKNNIAKKDEWAHASIENYLEACVAWYTDSKKYNLMYSDKSKNNEHLTNNPWRKCAEILYSGRIYE